MISTKKASLLFGTLAAFLVAACSGVPGGSSSSGTGSNTTGSVTIGGTIAGLTGTGLVLQDNAAANLTVAAGYARFGHFLLYKIHGQRKNRILADIIKFRTRYLISSCS